MRNPWFPALFSFALLPLFSVNAPVWAQDADNEAIAAAKKAALVIEGKGSAAIKPNAFYMKVEIAAEKVGRAATATEYQSNMETLRKALEKAGFPSGNPVDTQLLRRVGESSYQGVTGPENQDPPNSQYRLSGYFTIGVANPAKAREAVTVMRATGLDGNVTLSHYTDNEEAARLAALKAAITQAKQRIQVFSEAAKPKEFELVFLKEGDFQISAGTTYVRLQDKRPLDTLDTISAEANIVLFYGLKPMTGPAVPKVVATKATKATTKPVKKP